MTGRRGGGGSRRGVREQRGGDGGREPRSRKYIQEAFQCIQAAVSECVQVPAKH